MGTFIFLWLQNQHFYKGLQKKALDAIPTISNHKSSNKDTWADIGCSTGLMTRLAHTKCYQVTGYDLNAFSLLIAKRFSFVKSHIDYKQEDLFAIDETFTVISATSLLSVIDDEKKALLKLVSLLKDTHSTLIIIEPTAKMRIQNVKRHIIDFKSWWYYKGLLLWAKAREGKAVDMKVFDTIAGVTISHHTYVHDMVRVSYLRKT